MRAPPKEQIALPFRHGGWLIPYVDGRYRVEPSRTRRDAGVRVTDEALAIERDLTYSAE